MFGGDVFVTFASLAHARMPLSSFQNTGIYQTCHAPVFQGGALRMHGNLIITLTTSIRGYSKTIRGVLAGILTPKVTAVFLYRADTKISRQHKLPASCTEQNARV